MAPSPAPAPTPANCPACGAPAPPHCPDAACGACGVVFAKWAAREAGVNSREDAKARDAANSGPDFPEPLPGPLARLGYVAEDEAIAFVALRGILVLLLAWAGWRFAALNQPYGVYGPHFLHNGHLVFHEAGHIVFIPFGRFMTIAGGSLMQLIVPLAAALALLFKPKPDPFGAAVGVWWLGSSFVDLSPYIGDAQSLKLIMIGGFLAEDVPDAHDWRNILYGLDLLRYDRPIAVAAHALGVTLMGLGIAWGIWMLWRQLQAARAAEAALRP
jgi:hypothetical protein